MTGATEREMSASGMNPEMTQPMVNDPGRKKKTKREKQPPIVGEVLGERTDVLGVGEPYGRMTRAPARKMSASGRYSEVTQNTCTAQKLSKNSCWSVTHAATNKKKKWSPKVGESPR